MHWVISTAIVIIIIVIAFLCFLILPGPTVFFDPWIDEIDLMAQNHAAIEAETSAVTDAVTPIYGAGTVYDTRFPVIYDILRAIPGVKYAGLIHLKPVFGQVKRHGYAPAANNTVRYFYTIRHSATNKSGIWIDGASTFFCAKSWIVGDMSRENSLFNQYKYGDTLVLFMDVERPAKCPVGASKNTDVSTDEVLRMFRKE